MDDRVALGAGPRHTPPVPDVLPFAVGDVPLLGGEPRNDTEGLLDRSTYSRWGLVGGKVVVPP